MGRKWLLGISMEGIVEIFREGEEISPQTRRILLVDDAHQEEIELLDALDREFALEWIGDLLKIASEELKIFYTEGGGK